MSLSFAGRRKEILEILFRDGEVKVLPLAQLFDVSTETIRRDLDKLEQEGKLKKVYGGAIKSDVDYLEPPFLQRSKTNVDQKRAIGKIASSMVKYGETILIDHGTTTIEIIHHLKERHDITIVTHSVPTLLLAMEIMKGKIVFIGGEVNALQQSVSGALAEDMLQQINVHKAFISVGGITIEEGITDFEWSEASISRKMIERSEEVIVLADHTKFGKVTFANIAPLSDVDVIITDRGCSKEWIQDVNESNVKLIIAEMEDH